MKTIRSFEKSARLNRLVFRTDLLLSYLNIFIFLTLIISWRLEPYHIIVLKSVELFELLTIVKLFLKFIY